MKKLVFMLIATVLTLACVTQSAQADCGTCDKSIVEVAVAGDNFKKLVAAVKAADLAETLYGKGPFTVFAPTDDAFAKIKLVPNSVKLASRCMSVSRPNSGVMTRLSLQPIRETVLWFTSWMESTPTALSARLINLG